MYRVLETLKPLFTKKELCPQVILTNRDLTLMKAIKTVFPRIFNILCRFHINKNVKAKYKKYVMNDMRESIDKLWYELVMANDEVEYHQQLQQHKHPCLNFRLFFYYVKDTWLTPHRHRFVELGSIKCCIWATPQLIGKVFDFSHILFILILRILIFFKG